METKLRQVVTCQLFSFPLHSAKKQTCKQRFNFLNIVKMSQEQSGLHLLDTLQILGYRKFPKYSDTWKICCNHSKINHSKIWTMWLCHRNESKRCRWNGKQCRPWSDCSSGSALFAQTCVSENLGKLLITATFWLPEFFQIFTVYLPGISEPRHDKTDKMMCTQRRLRSAWASTQSDQSLCCLHEAGLGP